MLCKLDLIEYARSFKQNQTLPLEKEILGLNRKIQFSTLFLELVQKPCQVRFSYLLRHGNLCKGPRTLQKFWRASCVAAEKQQKKKLPQKPKDSQVLRVHRLWFPTSDGLETWLIPSKTTWCRQFNGSTTQLAPVPPLLVLCLVCQKERDKAEVSIRRGGTGASCVRPWLNCDIVETGSFWRG